MKQIIMLWGLITLLTLSPIAYAEICTTTLILCGDGTDDCNTITCYNNETNISGVYMDFDISNEYIDMTNDHIIVLWNESSQSYEEIKVHKNITIVRVPEIIERIPKLSILDRVVSWMNRIISPYLPESICPH